MSSISFEDEPVNNENSDLFLVDGPPSRTRYDDDDELNERLSQRPQAPPLPGSMEALVEEDENAAALAELEDVPMAIKKKRTINRGPKLDSKRLLSARGLPALSTSFKDVKLKGKGHEEDDLDVIMSTLEHWAHRLYPKFTFDDCLEKVESLGHKREIQTCMKRIRIGMPVLDDENQSTVITADGPQLNEGDTEMEFAVEPSTSYVDIFPAVINRTDDGTTTQEEVNIPEASSQPSISEEPALSPTFPAGFEPANYGAFHSEE